MLTLRRIEIENFVCFEELAIEPSTDPDRPLTVIRAENGSGKTTFLRAVRWGMYGDKGLPGTAAQFSLHPVSWHPDEAEVETRVSIEFETDGSSRNFEGTDTSPILYRLDRTVRTIGKATASSNEPDFRRVGEAVTLMVRELNGQWNKHEKHAAVVIEELVPWDLRDFFMMDTDEAADFVGGSENKPISRHEYQRKTSEAISSLLGLQLFKAARDRVEARARDFAARATKAIGDRDLDKLQEQLDQARAEREETEREIQRLKDNKGDLADKLQRLEYGLEDSVGQLSTYESWGERLRRNREEHELARAQRANCIAVLSEDLESIDLLAPLTATAVLKTYGILEPLHKQGRIPLAYVPFVQGLLLSERCVCGQDLAEGTKQRDRIAGLLADANEEAVRADYLYQLYEACLSLRSRATDSVWNERRTQHAASLADCDRRVADLDTEKRALDTKLRDIDEVEIQLAREQIEAVKQQIEGCQRDLLRREDQLEKLEQTIAPLEREIPQRLRNKREAADHLAAEAMAKFVAGILERGYAAIEEQQVGSLSTKMNLLFHEMAANVSDADFAEVQHSQGTLRMIESIGVRPVGDGPGTFEIYALNSRGRSMPPVEINGASRRVIALSFVLALCDESQTRAPLIADSLLNFMSRLVRRNTLRVTAEHSRQPILLLTSSDLEAPSELETVEALAGATYTLTGQWDAVGTSRGGDVVNRTQEGLVALLCQCGPREYCGICERTGQAETPGWTSRH